MSLPFQPQPKSVILGIDPGKTGAIAFLDTERWTLGVIDMPTVQVTISGKTLHEPSPAALANIVRDLRPILVVAEKLHVNTTNPSMSSTFKMGRWRGHIEMLTAAFEVAFTHVAPVTWKGAMGLTADKEISRHRASSLFPACRHFWARKMDHDRAEAAMLALYGCLELGLAPPRSIRSMKMEIEVEDEQP